MNYTIYLINRARSSRITRWSESRREAIAQHITAYYTEIIANGSGASDTGYTSASVTWEGGTMGRAEVACFFVDSRASSVISNYGRGETLDADGSCFPSPNGMIAEVYVDQTSSLMNNAIGALTMHELCHYKLDADPDDRAVPNIHTLSGNGLHVGRGGSGTFSPVMTDEVRDLMAARLGHEIAPFTRAEWGLHPRD